MVRRWAALCAAWLLGSVVCADPTALGQTADESALKAVYLFTFAKFTEWTDATLPAKAPMVMCVAGASPVLDALQQATAAREVNGHPLVVRRVDPAAALEPCHVLYAGGLDGPQVAALLERTRTLPILTVSDVERFARRGGTVGLFKEGSRLRFEVNLDAVQRGRLRVSSRLLSLAKIVKDEHHDLER